MDIFIPKPYAKEQVTIRIQSEKLREIDRLAEQFGLSRSEFMNQCVEYAIKYIGG